MEYLYGYEWIPSTDGKYPCNLRRWMWIPEEQDESGFWYQGNHDLVAYVMDHEPSKVKGVLPDCVIISKVSEAAAPYFYLPYFINGIPVPGEPLDAHEGRHHRGGKVHPKGGLG